MRNLFLLLLLASATPVAAKDEFCADRPGLATGTCIVPGGHVQIETSVAEYSRTRTGDTVEREWSLLPTQLRIGLDQATEVSFFMEPALRSRGSTDGFTERRHGAGDLTVALKRRLTSEDAKIVVAALPFVTLPTGSRDFTAGRTAEGLLVPIDTELGGKWSLTLTPEIDRNPDSEGRGHHLRSALSGELAYDVAENAEVGLGWLFARERDGDEHRREAQLGLDAAFRPAGNLQLDVEAIAGFARSSPDLQLITGVAVRF